MFHLFALLPLNVFLLEFINLATTCKINEFRCESGDCIDLDRYCNGVVECQDSSDEPRHCTPCNRTYYGVKSSTYNLQLHSPQATKSSFSCSLTFIAAGGPNGDLVQLKFNSIFLSKISPQQEISNCRNTKIIIQEPDRQIYSEFCHYSFINKPYFSETSRLILTFVTTELNTQLNFDFKLTFKFIGKGEASVRYGNGLFRGDLLPGTPCSLLFNNCFKETCSLQSPNYPGLYPRNVTCYYAIRHHNNPQLMNYHPVINLETLKLNIQSKQPNNLTYFNSKDFKSNCEDTLTVYDGYTIRDPVLVSVCGSGIVDNVTSSSNELLVEFHSSGVNLFTEEQQALHSIQGFNIIASIRHLPLNSNKYVENHNCVFRTSSLYNKSGFLESPNHSLPSKTFCIYHIQGNNHELVWLQLIYYHVYSTDCNTTYLSIFDGTYDSQLNGRNFPLLRICSNQSESLRSCEFKLNRNNSRPCGQDESYTSSSNQMTLTTRTEAGTILDQLRFKVYYEFIDTKQDGLELRKPCTRLITQSGYFHSPKSTFLYGRGGQRNVNCLYQFMPGTISLDFSLLDSPTCATVFNGQTHRYECASQLNQATNSKSRHHRMTGSIRYYKVYNNETRIQVSCFCTNVNGSLRFASKYSQQVEIILQNMESWVDSSHFYFNGSYSKERTGEEAESSDLRTFSGLSGLIHLTNGSVVVIHPPSNYYYAYVFNNDRKQAMNCHRNVLLVHNTSPSALVGSANEMSLPNSSSQLLKLCPNQVDLYSPNYDTSKHTNNKLIIELLSEVAVKLNYVMIQKQSEAVCEFYCASIDGCLPTQVLCNGLSDCPDSSDEANCHFNYNYEYLIVIFVIILIVLIILYIYHNCNRRVVKETGDS